MISSIRKVRVGNKEKNYRLEYMLHFKFLLKLPNRHTEKLEIKETENNPKFLSFCKFEFDFFFYLHELQKSFV